MTSETNTRANSFAMATIAAMGLLCVGLFNFGAQGGSNQFVRVYLCLVLALAGQIVLYHLLVCLYHRGLPGRTCPRWLAGAAGATVLAAGVAVTLCFYPTDGLWEQMPRWLMLAGVVLIWLWLWPWLGGKAARGNDRLPLAAVLLFAMFSYGAFCYVPNILNGSGHQIHHVTAVTQSVYNVAFNEPYTVRTSGMYGHYAIFFWPLVHLFGHKPQTVALLFAAFGALTQLLIAGILLKTVRHKPLVILALLATACKAANNEPAYLQTFPLRQLWPLAVLLYAITCVQKNSFSLRRLAVGYALCGLAMVWNTDSGLVTTVAFSAFVWLWHWRSCKPYARPMWKVYAQTVGGTVFAVVLMMAIINLYNLICGGPMILRACFYPLLGGDGYTEGLATSLMETGSYDWLLPVLMFSTAILLGLTTTFWMPILPEKEADRRLYLGFFGVMGLGQSYYFFNRALAGTDCVQVYFILCMALLAAPVLPWNPLPRELPLWRGLGVGVGLLMTVGLCGFSALAVVGAAPTLSTRIETGTYSMQSLLDVAAEVEARVPANTYAMGYATQELYGQLGWDPGYHQCDMSDIEFNIRTAKEENDQLALAMLADVNSQDSLLLHAWVMGAIKDNNDLVPEFGIPESEPVVYYCSRNVDIPAAFDTEDLGKNSLPIYQTKSTGINRRDNHYEFETLQEADMLLAADPIHEKGLVLRVDTDQEVFSSNGQEQFDIEVILEGKSVGTMSVAAAEDPQHLELVIPASEMPEIPADGLYRVELVCHTQEEVADTTIMYYLTYAGAPAE